MGYDNLRIRAYLLCGVVADRYMPLDGVLLYQAARYALGPQDVTLPGQALGDIGAVDVPLEKTGSGRWWYYRCSWAAWSHDVEGDDHWNKRFDSAYADLLEKAPRVVIERGPYRAYHMPVFYRVSDYIEWHARGDSAAIADLLRTVTHIGKKTAQGWGRVRRWEIEAEGVDRSVWDDGRLMRGVPAQDATGYAGTVMLYGIRPPYWRRENQVALVAP